MLNERGTLHTVTTTAMGGGTGSAAVLDAPVRLHSCVRCERVQLDGHWVSDLEAIRALRTFEAASIPTLVNATCPTCLERVERRRGAQRRSTAHQPGTPAMPAPAHGMAA